MGMYVINDILCIKCIVGLFRLLKSEQELCHRTWPMPPTHALTPNSKNVEVTLQTNKKAQKAQERSPETEDF